MSDAVFVKLVWLFVVLFTVAFWVVVGWVTV